jgi:CheY-like chemotaxis protein
MVADTIEGAGLGLAISARIASAMGGRMNHEANVPIGSVFWLEIPLTPNCLPGPPNADPTNARDISVTPPRVLRVLIADDVEMNREIAFSFLRTAGHEVICVDGGMAAVAAATTDDFDVILMDVRMPETDGLEATRQIRLLPGARGQVPIVALTGQAFPEQIAACREAGMNGHLSKPFTPGSLFRALQDQFKADIAISVAMEELHAPTSRFIA